MPIYDNSLGYDQMKRLSNNPQYVCAQCGGNLILIWGGVHNYQGYILRCANDIAHDGIENKRHNKSEKEKLQIQEYRRINKLDTTSLTTMSEDKMLARIEQAKFPQQLNPVDKKALAVAAITYGFDPLMNEITIYQGRPFISADGRFRKAQETERLVKLYTVPATKEEREAWQIPDGDFFFKSVCQYLLNKHSSVVGEVTGWGRVRAVETQVKKEGDTYKPIVTNPQRMAEKRAEIQALRKAFHIPLPSVEFIGSEESAEDYTPIKVIDDNGNVNVPPDETPVDTSTGEILDGEIAQPETVTYINQAQAKDLKDMSLKAGYELQKLIKDKGWKIAKMGEITMPMYMELKKELNKILNPPEDLFGT